MLSSKLSSLLDIYAQCGPFRQQLLINITDTGQEGVVQDEIFVAKMEILMGILPKSKLERSRYAKDHSLDDQTAKQLSELVTFFTKALSHERIEHAPFQAEWRRLQYTARR